jgi:hypothetical protein
MATPGNSLDVDVVDRGQCRGAEPGESGRRSGIVMGLTRTSAMLSAALETPGRRPTWGPLKAGRSGDGSWGLAEAGQAACDIVVRAGGRGGARVGILTCSRLRSMAGASRITARSFSSPRFGRRPAPGA